MGHPQRRWFEKIKPLLDGEVLRFQCLDGEEANREASLHSPQPGSAGTGGLAGTVAVEQFPLVFLRRTGPSPNPRYGYFGNDNSPTRGMIESLVIERWGAPCLAGFARHGISCLRPWAIRRLSWALTCGRRLCVLRAVCAL